VIGFPSYLRSAPKQPPERWPADAFAKVLEMARDYAGGGGECRTIPRGLILGGVLKQNVLPIAGREEGSIDVCREARALLRRETDIEHSLLVGLLPNCNAYAGSPRRFNLLWVLGPQSFGFDAKRTFENTPMTLRSSVVDDQFRSIDLASYDAMSVTVAT
jgi:hypothetical protein